MKQDIQRWESKYSREGYTPNFTPEADLVSLSTWFTGSGSALDLASGVGQNAIWLAEQGYKTTAIDGSQQALNYCEREAKQRNLSIETRAVDLDNHSLPEKEYDAIVIVRYLNRALFGTIKNAIKPNGLIFYKTFNKSFLQTKPDFNPDYVLKDGELENVFSDWKILAATESSDAKQSWLLAQKPA